jgi:hypothetical protein
MDIFKKAEKIKEIIKHVGEAKLDEYTQSIIWGIQDNGNFQHLLDINVRGWGAIQNYFKSKNGSINFESAEKFQDAVGKFIAEAINEKVKRETEM